MKDGFGEGGGGDVMFGRLAGVLERNANHPSVDHDANSNIKLNVRFGEHVDYIPKKEKIDPLAIIQTPNLLGFNHHEFCDEQPTLSSAR